MGKVFELWDMVSANMVSTFASEAEALAFIRQVIDDGQRSLVEEWALGYQDSRGRGKQLATGTELAERALRFVSA